MRARRYWRSGTALLLASLALVLGTVQLAAAGEDDAFTPGSGRANAKLVKIGPSRGALTLAPQVGLALSDFLNTRGRGDVRTADFAALGDSLPPEVVSALPSVKVESTDENSEAGRTTTVGVPPEVPVAASGVRLHADAGKAPYGASSVEVAAIDLGIGTIGGANASSWSGVVDGDVREARSEVVIPRLELAEGAVVLRDLRWHAIQRSGAAQAAEATFSVGGATIAGQAFDFPPGSERPLQDLLTALDPVLAPIGLSITLPVARVEQGVAEMTPLRIRVADSEVGNTVLGPALGGVQPVREQLVGAIREGSEDADAAILLTDVALGVLAGGSALDIELGGVAAFTAESADGFSFAFTPPSLSPASPVAAGPLATGSPSGAVGSGGGSGTPPAPAADDPEGAPELAGVPVKALGSRGGALLLVGLLGLGVATSLAAADYRKVRRGLRLVPAPL